ncbi:hypothetical protein PROFUN_03538 [Planoprotostelium fungivorum]|uniref:Heparan-alpha-glucosaminide N-acetyltransferase catalytic domain-containing protein n=1 Tax=Planoprotostelium fungivorum TaxID=1890364 RepID=A0A2P6MSE6_9EUKA|nr:hypothetical protein PROFUN_03538 [Planoprotostelium fungivorum]
MNDLLWGASTPKVLSIRVDVPFGKRSDAMAALEGLYGVRKVNEGNGDTFDCEVDADIEAEDLLSQLIDTRLVNRHNTLVSSKREEEEEEEEETTFVLKEDAVIAGPLDRVTVITGEKRRRLQCVDVLKGIAVVEFIMTQAQPDPSNTYHIFQEWDGLSNGDLYMPFFLFIVGISISFASRGFRRVHRGVGWKMILRQFLFLVVLHFITKAAETEWPYGDTFRIPGPLLKVAICYSVVSLSTIFLSRRMRRFFIVQLFFIYFSLTRGVFVPYCGRGVLTPNCNSAGYIDRLIFGAHKTYPNDSSGFVTLFSSIILTFIGLEYGRIIQGCESGGTFTIRRMKLLRWAGLSAFLIVNAVGGHYTWEPINRRVWSTSFVAATGGLCSLVLLVLYLLLDVSPTRDYKFLKVLFKPVEKLGMFPITIWMLMKIYIALFGNILRVPSVEGTSISAWMYLYESIANAIGVESRQLVSAGMAVFALFGWAGSSFVIHWARNNYGLLNLRGTQ